MDIDPLAPRYHLEIKATTRADPKRYRYEIWEKLDAPWLILTRGRYPDPLYGFGRIVDAEEVEVLDRGRPGIALTEDESWA